MAKFNQQEFNQFIIDQGILGFFEQPIKLVSGRMSSWYVNWRNVAADVFLLDKLSDYVINYAIDLGLAPDCFYGVPEGASKLGLICQYKWAKKQPDYSAGKYAFAMGRGKPKDHGEPKDKFFVGQPRGRVVILEDVTNTGKSLLETIEKLKGLDVKVVAAISMTNRNEKRDDGSTVPEALEVLGIKYYALSGGLELLPLMVKIKNPSAEVKKSIAEEFLSFGEKALKL